MAKKKGPPRWNPSEFTHGSDVMVNTSPTVVMTLEVFNRKIVEAYTLGCNHASEDANKNPSAPSSAQKLYSDRYAKLRDLEAYGVHDQPIEMAKREGEFSVRVMQGDLLDRFLDGK